MSEVKEKLEVVKQVRFEISGELHTKVMKYQARLVGRRGEKVTFADALIELLDKATKSIK